MNTEDGITGLELLQFCVQTTFSMTFIAMLAASVFFFFQTNHVSRMYRPVVLVSGVILLIAATNYFFMKSLYNMGDTFPTEYRYVDWILTTPLMLIKFPLLLGLGKKGRNFLVRLVLLDLLMIITGFFGELFFGVSNMLYYGFFAAGCLGWLGILYMLGNALRYVPERVGERKRDCIRLMGKFVLFGWVIYPVGYVLPAFGLTPDIRELVYNIGDAVNKIGLALVVYYFAAAQTEEEQKQRDEERKSRLAGQAPDHLAHHEMA